MIGVMTSEHVFHLKAGGRACTNDTQARDALHTHRVCPDVQTPLKHAGLAGMRDAKRNRGGAATIHMRFVR